MRSAMSASGHVTGIAEQPAYVDRDAAMTEPLIQTLAIGAASRRCSRSSWSSRSRPGSRHGGRARSTAPDAAPAHATVRDPRPLPGAAGSRSARVRAEYAVLGCPVMVDGSATRSGGLQPTPADREPAGLPGLSGLHGCAGCTLSGAVPAGSPSPSTPPRVA